MTAVLAWIESTLPLLVQAGLSPSVNRACNSTEGHTAAAGVQAGDPPVLCPLLSVWSSHFRLHGIVFSSGGLVSTRLGLHTNPHT